MADVEVRLLGGSGGSPVSSVRPSVRPSVSPKPESSESPKKAKSRKKMKRPTTAGQRAAAPSGPLPHPQPHTPRGELTNLVSREKAKPRRRKKAADDGWGCVSPRPTARYPNPSPRPGPRRQLPNEGVAKNGELLGPKVKGQMGYSKANI